MIYISEYNYNNIVQCGSMLYGRGATLHGVAAAFTSGRYLRLKKEKNNFHSDNNNLSDLIYIPRDRW